MLKFKKRRPLEYITYATVIVLGIILDQITKWLAVKHLMPIDTQPLIEGVLHFTYVENKGAAFGMLADARYVFLITSTVMILALSVYLVMGYAENKLYAGSVCLIISGGIGNMIDRLALGYVVDFIDFRLINFAVFNVADTFVCVGAGLLVLALVLDLIRETRAKRSGTDTKGGEEN